MAYSYPPLQNANSIRLLHLGPSCGSTPLKACLANYQFGGHCCYDALSYAWGEPGQTEILLIGDQELQISKNLYNILLHLRDPDKICTLWIDAICINQQDDFERGQQVAMMGQIYQQANTVLCWLGELSTHRLWALKYLQSLADEAHKYIKPDHIENFWTIVDEGLVPGLDVAPVIEDASEAHVDSIYKSEYFTRLWVVQEIALAKNPKLLCGPYILGWREFDAATRVLKSCLCKIQPRTETLMSLKNAMEIIYLRARHALNMGFITTGHVIIEPDNRWAMGRLAWDMRDKKCKDDKDRVFALLSVTTSRKSLGTSELELLTQEPFIPEPFIPDYTRPVEWAYYQFWRRFGGHTSLFFAGLSRRHDHSRICKTKPGDKDVIGGFNADYLPSWIPDLRLHRTDEWEPIFNLAYATTLPMFHKAAHLESEPPVLMIHGHRFDRVVYEFHLNYEIKPLLNSEDCLTLRDAIRSFFLLESQYGPYPSGQTWIEALGSTLITDMPDGFSEHPFQKYLDTLSLKTELSNEELQRIWKIYQDLFLLNTGSEWKKLYSAILSQKKFAPFKDLNHSGHLAWILHKYLGDILNAHHLIVTSRGYMGLGPPGTTVGDVVAVFGGPAVPFIVKDTTIDLGDLSSGRATGTLSQLLGPCYLQGIMDGELFRKAKYKVELEWEPYKIGAIPKPTLYLI